MKVKITYIILLFVFSLGFSQAQGRIIYKVTHDINTENFEKSSYTNIKQQASELLDELKEIKSRIPLNLDYNGQKSVFYADKQVNLGLSNSVFYNAALKQFSDYYRDDSTKEILEAINSEDKLFLVSSKTTDIQWTISNETKTIDNYRCIKATTEVWTHKLTKGKYKKTIEAWFTTSIPIKLGPKNYGGLPGLILELKDENFTYYVTNINLKTDYEINIERLKKGKLIDRKVFLDSRKTITKDELKELIKARIGG